MKTLSKLIQIVTLGLFLPVLAYAGFSGGGGGGSYITPQSEQQIPPSNSTSVNIPVVSSVSITTIQTAAISLFAIVAVLFTYGISAVKPKGKKKQVGW